MPPAGIEPMTFQSGCSNHRAMGVTCGEPVTGLELISLRTSHLVSTLDTHHMRVVQYSTLVWVVKPPFQLVRVVKHCSTGEIDASSEVVTLPWNYMMLLLTEFTGWMWKNKSHLGDLENIQYVVL